MLTLPARADSYTVSAYRTSPSLPPRDIAQEAYGAAVESLREQLKDDERALRMLESGTSMEDFQDTVDRAKATYESRHPKGKCVTLLRELSSRIMYYSNVLDMLSQHHPEYVALAWGSVKFVLTGIINHEKLVEHFSDSLVQIGNALKGAKLSAELYQNDQMKEAISHLYAHIILFFQQTVKWYTRSRIGRVVSAIVNPVELDKTVQQIQSCAETVRDLASAASRVEIRDIHVLLQLQEDKFQNEFRSMNACIKRLDEMTATNLQVATSTQALTTRISTSIADMQPRIYDIQFDAILTALAPPQSPSSSLAKIHSITNRASTCSAHFKDAPSTAQLLSRLDNWISLPGSRLFLVKVGLRAETKAKEFAADVITVLEKKGFPVFFTISQIIPSKDEDYTPSLISILKSLVFQALKHFPAILTSDQSQINIAKYTTEHSEAEWKSLFFKIFAKITRCFLVVEAQDLVQAHKSDPEWAVKFTSLWQELVEQAESGKKSIKILAVSYGNGNLGSVKRPFDDDDNDDERRTPVKKKPIISTVEAPTPVPPRLRKRMGPEMRRRQLREFQKLKPGF